MAGSGAGEFPYPIIADAKRDLAIRLGMLDADERDSTGMPAAARAVFIIGPDKKLKLSILYPATTGRNFDEILRVIDALQVTDSAPVSTPVDWKPGDRVIVSPAMSTDDARARFGEVEEVKPYLRWTPQPKA